MAQGQQASGLEIPKRLPLVVEPANRDSSTAKDARLVNCYAELDQKTGEYWVYKRAGLSRQSQPPGGAAAGAGTYNWNGDVYSVFGTAIYKNGSSLGTVDGTGGVYRFSQSQGSPARMVLGNGVKAYTYDGTTFAAISDSNFPSAFLKGWAYLDETTYVMSLPAAINGSGLNDPTTWDPLNVITAQIEPDRGVALASQLVYVVAHKQWTTEIFYDAANPTGSPLATAQGSKVNYGSISADSCQNVDGILIWLSNTRSASVQCVMMEGMKAEVVSTKAIDRLLKGLDYSVVYSWILKEEGHKFYVVTIKNANLTLAFDLVEKMWWQLTDATGNYLPIVSSTFDSNLNHIVQHESNGRLYYISRTYTNDDGLIPPVDIYTPNFDGGTRRKKTMNMLEVFGDQQPGSILQVRMSDDDYKHWTNFRRIYLDSKHPFITGCGTFRRRAHHFRHQCNTPMRIQAVGMQLDIGTL
jgi:hypothetical protein